MLCPEFQNLPRPLGGSPAALGRECECMLASCCCTSPPTFCIRRQDPRLWGELLLSPFVLWAQLELFHPSQSRNKLYWDFPFSLFEIDAGCWMSSSFFTVTLEAEKAAWECWEADGVSSTGLRCKVRLCDLPLHHLHQVTSP